MNRKDLDELQKAAMPLIEWMRDNDFNPQDQIIVDRISITVTEVTVHIPNIGL